MLRGVIVIKLRYGLVFNIVSSLLATEKWLLSDLLVLSTGASNQCTLWKLRMLPRPLRCGAHACISFAKLNHKLAKMKIGVNLVWQSVSYYFYGDKCPVSGEPALVL